MKIIEFKDLDSIKYKPVKDFNECLKDTPLYRQFGCIHGGTLEHEGELYMAELYPNDVYVWVQHIDTGRKEYSKYKISNAKNPINIKCKYLAHKILNDWIKEAKRIHYGVREEIKK